MRTGSRNAFLDMLISEDIYRNNLNEFVSAIISDDFEKLEEELKGSHALFFLFILKPHLREHLLQAVRDKNRNEVVRLVQQLFGA